MVIKIFEIITWEKYILTVLILTKPNQPPHLTIISPQACCSSVTLSERLVRWWWCDGGEGRRGEERVARSIYVWLVSSGPQWSPGYKHSNCWAPSCPEISTPRLAYFALLSPVFPPSQQNPHPQRKQTNSGPTSPPLLCILETWKPTQSCRSFYEMECVNQK